MSKNPMAPFDHFVVFRSFALPYNGDGLRFVDRHRGPDGLTMGKRSGEIEDFPDRRLSIASADEAKLLDFGRFRGRGGPGSSPCLCSGGGRSGMGRVGRGAPQPPVELRDPGVGGDHPSPVYRSGIGGGGGGGPAGGAPDHEPGNQGRARRRSTHRQSGGGYGSPRPDREKAGPSPVRGVDGFLPGSDSPLLPDQHPRSDGGGEEGPT